MSDDDFSDAPQSITEIRGNRQKDSRIWTARDALVSLLREIDSGNRKVDVMFIATLDKLPDGDTKTGFHAVGKHHEVLGVAHYALEVFNRS